MSLRIGLRILAFVPWLVVLASPQAARAACSVTQDDFDASGRDDVRILGDSAHQQIVIIDNQIDYQVLVDCNGDGDYLDPADIDTGVLAFDIETFDVQGRGKDTVSYETTSTFSAASKNLLVTLGPSTVAERNIVEILTIQPVQANSSIVVDILGSAGPDLLDVLPIGAFSDSSLVLRGDLGAGDDSVFYFPIGAVLNSVLSNDLSLGLGSNSVLLLAGGPSIDNSTLLFNAEGGSGATQPDEINWYAQTAFLNASRYITNLSLLAGNDRLNAAVKPALSIQSGSSVVLRARGGAGNDSFAFNDGNGAGAVTNAGLLDVDVSGGAGNDLMTVDWTGSINGNGTSRFRLAAGDGTDTLFAAFNLDSSGTTPNLDVLLQGGKGNDALFSAVLDASGSATYHSFGTTLSDGGPDADSCIFFGDGLNKSLSCESGS